MWTIAFQLGLVLVAIGQWALESRTFLSVMAVLAAGFVVHARLPLHRRLPCFAALSLLTVVVAFGPRDGLSLIALGLSLIGICHLRARLAIRVAALGATAVVFALWRVEWLPAPWSVAIWPVLGSMFMFRVALYLRALARGAEAPTPARTLAYFFMAPNVCFPLYPVIDYAAFVRTHDDRDATPIYATGTRFIVRGLVHLILYRVVNRYLVEDPAQLVDLGQVVQFMVATFLLYLRVSGQFHLIVGVLHLFGFRLPETHHLYVFASSFTDFWRRTNVYWRNFMHELVFLPGLVRLRRAGAGPTPAVVGAIVAVFAATWLLHSYQWFWLRGGFPLTVQEGLFWGILCLLVVRNSLRELARPPKGGAARWSLARGLRTAGVFAVICGLWSLWTADSVVAWVTMAVVAAQATPTDLAVIAALVIAFVIVAGWPWSAREPGIVTPPPFHRRPAATTALLVVIVLGGATNLYAAVSPAAAAFVASLQRTTLSPRDASLRHRGYYEQLDQPSRVSLHFADALPRRPDNWPPLEATVAWRARRDFPRGDLRPGIRTVCFGRWVTIDAQGMRDRNRPTAKPAGTYRIAFLGPSIVMGVGVGDDETVPVALEERLNRGAGGAPRYEVLNFGVADYSLLEQLAQLEEKALAFAPDAVFVAESPRFRRSIVRQILAALDKGAPVPYPGLNARLDAAGIFARKNEGLLVPFETVRRLFGMAGVRTRMPWTETERRLWLIADDLVAWTLRALGDAIRAHGAVPVFVFLDNVGDPQGGPSPALRQAAEAGFLVFDLIGLWEGRDKTTLRLAPWDDHPNADGARLLAAGLDDLIRLHRPALRLSDSRYRGGP